MTLLVGIFCDDGIVIAADRMATRGSMAQSTVGSPVVKVVSVKTDAALYAFSGYTGLGQMIGLSIDQQLDTSLSYFVAVQTYQPQIRAIILQAMQMARQSSGIVPDSQGEAVCSCLLAAKFADGLKLIEISPQGAFDIMNDIRWTCIGGGQANADPFMSFLWSVYWHDRNPSVEEAAVMACWAIDNVSKSGTAGVGLGIDVFIMKDEDGTISVRQLPDAEIEYNLEFFVAGTIRAMRDSRDLMRPTPETEAQDASNDDELPQLAPESPNDQR